MNIPLLMIIRSSPYANLKAREGLDAALAFAAFDQPPALLFMDDGVFQLCRGQKPQKGKSQEKMLSALPLYGVERIYLHQTSIVQRGLTLDDLGLPAQLVSDASCRKLFEQARHTLSF